MRAVVYGVERNGGGWRWGVSVALEADKRWWRERGAKRLWLVGGGRGGCGAGGAAGAVEARGMAVTVSLGQAVERCAELELELERERGTNRGPVPGGGEWVEFLEGGRGEFMPEAQMYERFMALLEGRLLLREEIEALLLDRGLGALMNVWAAYVQWGVLEGRLRLRCGVEREENAPRPRERWLGLARGMIGFGAGALRRIGLLRGGAQRWRGYRCVRCGSGGERLRLAACPACAGECPYCESCLGMGRARYCSLVVQGLVGGGSAGSGMAGARSPEEHGVSGQSSDDRPSERERSPGERSGMVGMDSGGTGGSAARWKLSPAQAEAVGEALRFLDRPGGGAFLLWAVTGAGKTEMMFPLVERVASSGGRVLVATPRRDVVLELAPRFVAAFPGMRVVTLYGGSAERWETGTITIATTHQLFRFRAAFDLVVLDEVDAFPFHGDASLAFAAEAARRPGGAYVLLSATPPEELRRAAERGRLPHARVCVRFHGRPLPVPRRLPLPPLRRWAAALPPRLRTAAEASLRRGAQLFVFVPHIAAIPGVVRRFAAAFPGVAVGGTSSQDAERGDKVTRFRAKELRILVTTTILERGVTVPKTDVFILDADNALFDGAALVQMAGRAGRKLEDPSGNVYFCSSEWTRSQKGAIRDIRAMNRLARRKGFLHE